MLPPTMFKNSWTKGGVIIKNTDLRSRVVRSVCNQDKCCPDKCHFNNCILLEITPNYPIILVETSWITAGTLLTLSMWWWLTWWVGRGSVCKAVISAGLYGIFEHVYLSRDFTISKIQVLSWSRRLGGIKLLLFFAEKKIKNGNSSLINVMINFLS